MRLSAFVIILSLLFGGVLPARACAESLESGAGVGIEVALQMQTILAETVAMTPAAEIDRLDDSTGPDYLKSIAARALDAGLKSQVEAQARKSGIARMAARFKWKSLWGSVEALGSQLRITARLKGRTIAILAVTGAVVKTAHFVTCLAIGRPELIPLTSSFVPGPLPMMTAGAAIAKLLERKKQVLIYDGVENLAAVNASLKEARGRLGLLSPSDFLVPFTADETQSLALVARQSGWLNRIKGFFGKVPTSVDFDEFAEFARDQSVPAEFLTGLKQFELPVSVKMLWVLQELETIHGVETAVKIGKRFPGSVVARELPVLSEAWVSRVLALRGSKTLSELLLSLSDPIPAISAAMNSELAVIRVWNRLVVPTLAENLERGVSVTQFRKLLHASLALQAQIETGRFVDRSVLEQLKALVKEIQASQDCEQPLIPSAV